MYFFSLLDGICNVGQLFLMHLTEVIAFHDQSR